MKTGDLVLVPSIVHDWRKRVTYVYLCQDDLTLKEDGIVDHFEVPLRTVGLLLTVGLHDPMWCKVMFPQGVGWVSRSWLEVVPCIR